MKNHANRLCVPQNLHKANFEMDEITITPCPATQGSNVIFLNFCSRKGYGNCMLCQNCGKYEATTHVKRIINGETAEAHLCSDCAHALGYTDVFGGFSTSFSDLLGSFFGESSVSALSSRTVRCEKCGSTFNDIVNSGKIGCADCYRTFYDKLLPSLQRIHGKTRHEGKIPKVVKTDGDSNESKITRLENELKDAVERQDFERAAKLRDEIKELKGDGKNE